MCAAEIHRAAGMLPPKPIDDDNAEPRFIPELELLGAIPLELLVVNALLRWLLPY